MKFLVRYGVWGRHRLPTEDDEGVNRIIFNVNFFMSMGLSSDRIFNNILLYANILYLYSLGMVCGCLAQPDEV